MPDRTDSPDAASTDYSHARGLPDDPNLEMELAARSRRVDARWLDAVCVGCHAAVLVRPGDEALCPQCRRDNEGDEPDPPPGSALFPEVPTWTVEQLVVTIELTDRREPALGLYANGAQPDRPEAFLHEGAASLVQRLEERGSRLRRDVSATSKVGRPRLARHRAGGAHADAGYC